MSITLRPFEVIPDRYYENLYSDDMFEYAKDMTLKKYSDLKKCMAIGGDIDPLIHEHPALEMFITRDSPTFRYLDQYELSFCADLSYTEIDYIISFDSDYIYNFDRYNQLKLKPDTVFRLIHAHNVSRDTFSELTDTEVDTYLLTSL